VAFHLPLRAALTLSGKRSAIRTIARASNSAFRPGTPAWRARWNNCVKYGDYDLTVAFSRELADEIADSQYRNSGAMHPQWRRSGASPRVGSPTV